MDIDLKSNPEVDTQVYRDEFYWCEEVPTNVIIEKGNVIFVPCIWGYKKDNSGLCDSFDVMFTLEEDTPTFDVWSIALGIMKQELEKEKSYLRHYFIEGFNFERDKVRILLGT